MFELLPNHKSRRYFDIAYTAVAVAWLQCWKLIGHTHMPGHWRLLQTDCNECRMLRHVLSVTPGNLIVACHGLCIPSFIGWTFLNESSTSSVCSCTDASTTKLLGTWWTTAHQYPTLTIVNGYSYVLPVVIKSLFHVTDSVPKDVGHLPLLDRLSGTLCQRTCGIQRFLRTVTGTQWRRFYLCSTSVFSALEVFTRMRYINPHLTFDWKQPHHLRHVSVSHTEDNIFKTYYSQAKSTQMLSGEISRSNLHSVEWHLSV